MQNTKVKGHWRTIRLRNGSVVKRFIPEHVRRDEEHGGKPNRWTHEAYYPLERREEEERYRAMTEDAVNRASEMGDVYIPPQDYTAAAYMAHQQMLLHRRRRGRL